MSTMEVEGRSRRTVLSRYLRDVRMLAPLTHEQAAALAAPLGETGDETPHHELVEANLAFVVQVARRYVGMGLSFEDLISEGNVGLVEAARHFDPARGTKFITYAVWWIRKAILAALSDQTASVRLPHTLRTKVKTVLEAGRQITAETGGDAGRDEIALRLRTSIERIDRILQYRGRDLSFEETLHADTETQIQDSLPDRKMPDPEHALIERETCARVRRGLRELGERERRVLSERFGLGDGPSLSLRALGGELGVSREAIRLIEVRAKKELGRILDGRPVRRGSRLLRRSPPRSLPATTPRPRASARPDGGRRAPRT